MTFALFYEHAIKNWKSSLSGLLTAYVALFSTLTATDFAGVPGFHWSKWFLLSGMVAKVILGLFQTDGKPKFPVAMIFLLLMLPGCVKPKPVPVAVAPSIRPALMATAKLVTTPAPYQCPTGTTSVATVTALDPNFAKADVNVTYIATGDGNAIPCISTMAARTSTATNSNVPNPN